MLQAWDPGFNAGRPPHVPATGTPAVATNRGNEMDEDRFLLGPRRRRPPTSRVAARQPMDGGEKVLAGAKSIRSVIDKVQDEASEAKAAVADLRNGFDEAKQLVERTRSLLAGEVPYDEGEMAMIAAQASSQAAAPVPSDSVQNPADE